MSSQQQTQILKEPFVHESSYVDEGAVVGAGTKIWHFCHVMHGATIGRNCNIGQNVCISPGVTVGDNVKIQNNVSLYTGVVVEDDVFLGPSMVFTNVINPRSHVSRKSEYRKTVIKRGATIGANATILCGATLGRYAFVGAGAVVTGNLPDYALAFGSPARVRGWMCQCGIKLAFEQQQQGGTEVATCRTCNASYVKVGDLVKPAASESNV